MAADGAKSFDLIRLVWSQTSLGSFVRDWVRLDGVGLSCGFHLVGLYSVGRGWVLKEDLLGLFGGSVVCIGCLDILARNYVFSLGWFSLEILEFRF